MPSKFLGKSPTKHFVGVEVREAPIDWDEEWVLTGLIQNVADMNHQQTLSITIRSESGAQLRMGVQSSPHNEFPFSPFELAELMENLAFWVKTRFDDRGRLTAVGKERLQKLIERSST